MPTVLTRQRKNCYPTVITNEWGAHGKEFRYMAESASGQDKANPVFLLATQAILTLLGYLALVPSEKCSRFGHDKSLVDKACSVKISGY